MTLPQIKSIRSKEMTISHAMEELYAVLLFLKHNENIQQTAHWLVQTCQQLFCEKHLNELLKT